jgi:hypothetical protein
MSTTAPSHNDGSAEWQSLAAPHERRGNRGTARTRESLALEAELRRLLADYAGDDISGVWLDFRNAAREPVWLPAPGSDAGEAA